jgi:hypothetical protein
LTLRLSAGRLVITRIAAFAEPGTRFESYRDAGPSRNVPWDNVALTSARGGQVTVMAPASGTWQPSAYLPAAQRAAALVRSLWGTRTGAPGFTIFLADDQQFASWFASRETDRHTIGYATFADVVEPDGQKRLARPNTALPKPGEPMWKEQTAGARIVLRMSAITSPAEAQHIMAHEMAHAVGPHLMRWTSTDAKYAGVGQATRVLEGFARWVEHLDEPGSAARGLTYVRRNKTKYRQHRLHDRPNNPPYDRSRVTSTE